jgi:hypothetical protein
VNKKRNAMIHNYGRYIFILLIGLSGCELDPDFKTVLEENDRPVIFITDSHTAGEVIRVVERDSGYVAFARNAIVLFDHGGEEVAHIDLAFYFSDLMILDNGDILIAAAEGGYYILDEDFILSNSTTGGGGSFFFQDGGGCLWHIENITDRIFISTGPCTSAFAVFLDDYAVDSKPPVGVLGPTYEDTRKSYRSQDGIRFIFPALWFGAAPSETWGAVLSIDLTDVFPPQCLGSGINADGCWINNTLSDFFPVAFTESVSGQIVCIGRTSMSLPAIQVFSSGTGAKVGSTFALCDTPGERPADIIRTIDNQYATVSQVSAATCSESALIGGNDVKLSLLSAEFDVVWTRTYPLSTSQDAFTVIQTKDKGYLIGGTTKAAGTDRMLLIKTDKDGKAN